MRCVVAPDSGSSLPDHLHGHDQAPVMKASIGVVGSAAKKRTFVAAL